MAFAQKFAQKQGFARKLQSCKNAQNRDLRKICANSICVNLRKYAELRAICGFLPINGANLRKQIFSKVETLAHSLPCWTLESGKTFMCRILESGMGQLLRLYTLVRHKKSAIRKKMRVKRDSSLIILHDLFIYIKNRYQNNIWLQIPIIEKGHISISL